MIKNNTTWSLGAKETEVVARLSYEKSTILTAKQFDKFFNFSDKSRNNIIYRLKKKGILKTIKKGVYIFSPLETGKDGRNINEFLIAPYLVTCNDYYIGYSTMYNYYGFIDQIYQTMYILNTFIQREKVLGNIQYKMIKVSKKRMYGLRTIKIENKKIIVTDKERTLLDLIFFSDPVGGQDKAFDILKNQVENKKINIKKFITYASLFPSISTRKRIGFLLEKFCILEKELTPLLRSIKRTSLITLYNTKSRKGKINKKWGVIENAS